MHRCRVVKGVLVLAGDIRTFNLEGASEESVFNGKGSGSRRMARGSSIPVNNRFPRFPKRFELGGIKGLNLWILAQLDDILASSIVEIVPKKGDDLSWVR